MFTVPSSASTVSTESRWSDEALSASISNATLPSWRSVSAMLAARAGIEASVEAPRPWPGGGDVEEDEAIEDRRVAAIVHREEVLRRVCVPIGDRHRAGREEGGGAGEQADGDEEAANQLHDSGEMAGMIEGPAASGHLARREREELLSPVSEEDQAGDHSKHAQQTRRPGHGQSQIAHEYSFLRSEARMPITPTPGAKAAAAKPLRRRD